MKIHPCVSQDIGYLGLLLKKQRFYSFLQMHHQRYFFFLIWIKMAIPQSTDNCILFNIHVKWQRRHLKWQCSFCLLTFCVSKGAHLTSFCYASLKRLLYRIVPPQMGTQRLFEMKVLPCFTMPCNYTGHLYK